MNRRIQWILIILGSAVYGLLMGVRQDLSGLWTRAGVAAAAGGVLGLVLIMIRKAVDVRNH